MSRQLFFSIVQVNRFELSPSDWIIFGPYLRINGINTFVDKYLETDDPPGQGLFDYWEVKIDLVTFTRPLDFLVLDYLQGDRGPESYRRWDYISVPDDFVIPAQFDTSGLAGAFRYLPSGNGISANTVALGLAGASVDNFTSVVGGQLKTSFWGLVDRYVGSGVSTAIQNVDTARAGIFDVFDRATAVLNFGLDHFNDPNIANFYATLADGTLANAQDRLLETAVDITTFPGSPVTEAAFDRSLQNMRIILSAVSGVAAGTANVDIGLTLDTNNSVPWNGTTGADVLIDGAGSSSISGGAGNDIIFGGGGNDIIYTSGADFADGGSGNDTISVTPNSGSVGGYAIGGDGIDTVLLSSGSSQFTVNLESGTVSSQGGEPATAITIVGFENVDASSSGNRGTIIGSNGVNRITGSTGNDTISGEGGNDTIIGGFGYNIIDGGSGDDLITSFSGLLRGGVGNDVIITTSSGTVAFIPPSFDNSTFETATPLDYNFKVTTDPSVDTSVSSVSSQLRVIGSGTAEYFLISVNQPRTVVIDIDATTNSLDTVIRLYDSNRQLVAGNDDSFTDSGSTSLVGDPTRTLDSFLRLDLSLAGTYYIEVIGFPDQPIPNGSQFTLNVSMAVSQTSGLNLNTTLYGQDGDDLLSAAPSNLSGALFNGGAGFDTASFVAANAAVTASLFTGIATYNAGNGNSNVSLVEIESLVGSNFNDTLIGSAAANRLEGGNGDDELDGGTGIDTLVGGFGNDNYHVENSSDTVIESVNGGIDQINTNLSLLVLSNNVEILKFTGGLLSFIGIGNATNNIITGGIGRDELYGNDGNDILNDGGGSNSDTLVGGRGDDIYFVNVRGDSTVESQDQGYDEIRTSLSSLVLAANIEALTYTGGSATFVGIGNIENNDIVGGTGIDQLSGLGGNDELNDGGGAGADTLIGGAGDDFYIIGNRGSSTIELAGEGVDEVQTTLSVYGLQANIENLCFTDEAKHGAGVGNELDNFLYGNLGVDDLFGRAGNDTLRGGSGAANSLFGQEGDDIYIVEAVGDSIIEFANQGIDTVQTALASLVLRDHVENLTYTGTATFTGIGASGANTIIGGALDDFLSGLDGADILVGKSGADFLLGGAGSDQYRYEGGEAGFDRITDFVSGVDKIALRDAGFAQTASFVLAQGGTPVATSTSSTFLYNINTGILSFDADGSGAGAAVTLAQLNGGLTLAAGDFVFY